VCPAKTDEPIEMPFGMWTPTVAMKHARIWRYLHWAWMEINTRKAAPWGTQKGKGSPYSITQFRVPELIPVLGSQPADDAPPSQPVTRLTDLPLARG